MSEELLKIVIPAVVGLLGIVLGYFFGKWDAERKRKWEVEDREYKRRAEIHDKRFDVLKGLTATVRPIDKTQIVEMNIPTHMRIGNFLRENRKQGIFLLDPLG